MTRLMLTDELWSKLRIIMRQHGVYDKPNLRMSLIQDPDLEWEFMDGSLVKAHHREKQLKGWLRRKKIAFIEQNNPDWKDLS